MAARVVPARDAGAAAAAAGDRPAVSPDAGGAARDDAAAALAVATQNYVVVPSPREHAIALIDARTFQTLHVPCADAPALAAAAPDADVAVVADVSSETACVLHPAAGEAHAVEVAVVPHANRIELAPFARFAVAFHDASVAGPDDVATVTQELTAIALDPDDVRAGNAVVGLRPRALAFSSDGLRAVVASDTGISELELADAARGLAANAVPLDFDWSSWSSAVVLIAPDARLAIAFEPGAGTLHGFDLQQGVHEQLELSAWAHSVGGEHDARVPAQVRIADVALASDGATAWLALAGERMLLRVPLPDGLTRPELIESRDLAEQASDRLQWAGGESGLFVYARDALDGRSTLVSPETGDALSVVLARAPDTLLTAERGEALGLIHDGARQPPAGYTLLRVRDGAARFRQTAARPVAMALSSAAGALAVAVASDGDAEPELQIETFDTLALRVEPLPAAPRAVGFVRGGRLAFAQLVHPDGELSFVDLQSDQVTVSTGFLIAERVRE